MELKGRIEENAEACDECTLIDDPVEIEDAKSEAYDECKLLLPSPEELMEELAKGGGGAGAGYECARETERGWECDMDGNAI
jgi:hypothetical protein